MRIVVDDNDINGDWDEFVLSSPFGHHVQTYEWGLLKKFLGWNVSRIIALDQKQIIAGAQILTRTIPLLGRVGYITKGPISSDENPEMISTLLQKVFELAKERNYNYIAIQPPNQGDFQVDALTKSGYRMSSLELAPSASLVLDLEKNEDGLYSEMSKETRQRVVQSKKSGLDVRIGSETDLDTFYQLYLSTAHRQRFSPFSQGYFRNLWNLFYAKGWIALLLVYSGDEPISGQLLVPFADTVIAKKMGWSGSHSRSRPNDAMFWASILWSKEQGYRRFDFEGLDPAGARIIQAGGVIANGSKLAKDTIKYGYGGEIVFYPGAYDLVLNPLENWAYRRTQHLIQKVPVFNQIVDFMRNR